MLHSYMQGLAIGFSLIIAIGAQNAFILKQGLKKQYVFWLCAICAASDSILILLGVLGFSQLVESHPEIVGVAKYLGATFLAVYGAQHFLQAFKTSSSLAPSEKNETKLLKLVLICLALTWLNPHVYLDTVVLIGSISTKFESTAVYFAIGAITASWVFFFVLGYGARYLLPLFQSAKAWKVLDFIIGVVMWGIAASLLL
ncbi:LysE/ArgO family amino acid transporter [Acinetobacter amyesii]|uniref:LysE/ArgO family amino acid transporter n=1 Tax=Acinetobacter amyesii TaxID=2942470 RepID=UPI0020C0906F|nr:LysE/ArgO family amino acid transporter [Acinetobacter amyesii]MCL6240549.1 LysE/ArgO family amino acid transporter [Acinetobacter amyesii]